MKIIINETQYRELLNEADGFIPTDLSRKIVNYIKSGEKNYFTDRMIEGHVVEIDVDIEYKELPEGMNHSISGGADIGFDEMGNMILDINLKLSIDPNDTPNSYSDIIGTLKETLRHEIEHILQYINPNKEQAEEYVGGFEYLTARHEVPAFVHGLYQKAKSIKKPLIMVLKDALTEKVDDGEITEEDYDGVLDVWLQYAKRNLPKGQY
jgi:hypothetical protein